MDKTFDILCIGLIVTDLLVRPVSKEIFNVDATKVDKINVMPGGDAANESIILSRLGMKVGLVGKVGSDLFGKIVLDKIKDNNVDISNVKIDKNTITSTSIVLINGNGDRNFVYCSGNNDALSIEDIDLSIIKKSRLINIGSIFGLPLLDKCGVEVLFKEAKANGVLTSADATHDGFKLGFDGIKKILKYTDIFLPSYAEAVYITGEKELPKIADILLNAGVKTVVIKLGEEGCYIKSEKESYLIEPFKAETIDTTGAGDNFVAGFLTGVLEGWDLKKCGMFANAVGCLCVQNIGATSSVESMGQVMNYMEGLKYSNKIRKEGFI